GARVDGAESERAEVDDDRRREGGGNGGAVAADPARKREGKRCRGDEAAEVEGGRGTAGVTGREAEVAPRPDPERLERRDLVAQVAEAAADRRRPEGPKVGEVDDPAPLGGGQDQQDDERCGRNGEGRRVDPRRTLGIHA